MPDETRDLSRREAIATHAARMVAGVILLVVILASDWPAALAVVPAILTAYAIWQLFTDVR